MCEHLKTVVQVLGCPKCLSKKKAAPLLKFAQQHGIKRVLIEKSDPFCLYVQTSPEKIASFLHGKGLAIDYVDFTKGLGNAVRQAADLLGCAEKVVDVLAVYDKAMQKTRAKMAGMQFPGKVVMLKGVYQNETGKAFIQVEAPGGYSDRLMLQPMACENVGDKMYPAEKKPVKGYVTIRRLDGLTAAAPDAIVMTGDAIAVQKALAQAIQKNQALGEVPAVKTHAVYSLDSYIDSSVLEYPLILRRWADILAR
jgi:ABC-type Fe3+-hydroxamate transport system substrate-binding protein